MKAKRFRRIVVGLAIVIAVLCLSKSVACSQIKTELSGPESKQGAERAKWFQDAKFGMFIHWGLYSVPAKGEWVMHQSKMTVEEYEKLAAQFNPVEYDAAQWVGLAKGAGMRYITITSKHHDGFAMWDSKISDWDIVDRTPYTKDVLKMLAEECGKQNMPLFFYYSHLDWHHPDYYPRGWTGGHSGRPERGDFNRYLDYMNSQIAELCSGRYGQVAGFWFDGWWDQQAKGPNAKPRQTHVDWQLQETYALIHKLQPQALIGNNHHVAPFAGEGFQMFERGVPGKDPYSKSNYVSQLPLETCDTINKSWGYNSSDKEFKSTKELIHYLVRAAGYNANFLLNVGPMPNGKIQPEFVERLQDIGKWMSGNGETIYGTRGGPMPPQKWGVTTHKKDKVYVHILKARPNKKVVLPEMGDLSIKSALLFKDGGDVNFSSEENLVLELAEECIDPIDTIVVLKIEGK